MRIFVDVQGTTIGNPVLSDDECYEAMRSLRLAGHEVETVSSAPGSGDLDKGTLFEERTALRGAVYCDDTPELRAIAARMGAVAVPAEMLGWLAEVLG